MEDFETATVAELRAACRDKSIGSGTWRAGASKADLVAALQTGHTPATAAAPDLASVIAAAVQSHLDLTPKNAPMDEDRVRAIAKEEAEKVAPGVQRLEIKLNEKGEAKDMGVQHERFPTLLKMLAADVPVWLAGPSGSGKTTAVENAARALELPFEFNGAIDSEHKLLGFIDAQGRTVSRPFRKAFEHGSVYLFDEVDASMPSALLAFNAALANGYADFPDGKIDRHAKFRVVAAGNTWNGQSSVYCGRAKQDAAFLDRFAFLEWPYDERLECAIAGVKYTGGAQRWTDEALKGEALKKALNRWPRVVQHARMHLKSMGSLQHIISPRATFYGLRLLKAGCSWETCIASLLQKGLTFQQFAPILSVIGGVE